MSKPRLLLTKDVLAPFLNGESDPDMGLLLMLGRAGEFELLFAAHEVEKLIRALSPKDARWQMEHLLKVAEIVKVGEDEVRQALRDADYFFDNALLEACAVSARAHAIIGADCASGAVREYTPKAFFEMLSERYGINYAEVVI